MKKILYIIPVLLLIMPLTINASITGNVSLSCDKTTLDPGETTNCKVHVNLTGDPIANISYKLKAEESSAISFSNYTVLGNNWALADADNGIFSGVFNNDQTSSFDAESFKITANKAGVTSVITVYNIKMGDGNNSFEPNNATLQITINNVPAYTLTYNNNGGSGCTSTSAVSGSNWNPNCTPTRTGYTFTGWYDNSGNKITSSTAATKDMEAIARWEANTYTLTYDNNGGSGCTSTTGVYGEKWNPSCAPTKKNSIFDGWFSKLSGGAEITKQTQVTKDLTAYAHWTSCQTCKAGTGATCSLSVVNNACVYTTTCKSGYENITNDGKYNPSCSPVGTDPTPGTDPEPGTNPGTDPGNKPTPGGNITPDNDPNVSSTTDDVEQPNTGAFIGIIAVVTLGAIVIISLKLKKNNRFYKL